MVISLILLLGAFYALGARFGLKPGFRIRFLTTLVRIPRHRTALTAQCPVLPNLPPEIARSLPIHVSSFGDSGPTVLLIHGGVQGGLGGGPATFRHQQPLADQGWRLKIVDRPGFGKSPSRGPDDMEADAEWVAATLGDGTHLVGHSFGGAVSLLAAARRPSAVRSLTLIEPALVPILIGSKSLKGNELAREDFLRMIQSWVTTRTPAEYARALMQDLGVASSGLENGTEDHVFSEKRATDVGCAFLRARLASRRSLVAAARTIASAGIPVLVVTGGWSATFEAVGEIAAELTRGQHIVVASPDHFVQVSAADEFNRKVTAFMNSAEAPAGRS